MDRDKLIQRLRATFAIELREHVETFNRELLALEKGSNDAARADAIKTLFRTAHSLKGAARAVSASKLEQECHNLEELLSGLRDGSRQLTPSILERLFKATDMFEAEGREISASVPAPAEQAKPAPQKSAPSPKPVERTAVTPSLAAPSPPVESSVTQPATPPPTAAASSSAPEPSRSGLPSPSSARVSLAPAQATANIEPSTAPNRENVLRVPEHKLDSLLAGSSELLIARRRLDARRTQLAALNERVSEMRAISQRAGRALHSVSVGRSGAAARVARLPARGAALDSEQFVSLERAMEAYSAALAEDLRALERAASDLDERIHQVRMLPFEHACDALHRSVRDLAARERKPTELEIEGGEIELDRSIVDGLRAPLLHLVRNAIDHGIETADERSSAGKPPRSTLKIAATLRGDRVEVSVQDDGRGIDLERIREQLRKNGMAAPADDQEVLRAIFEPGFSTAPHVTDVSGRGVGLDVVRTQIESLRGSVGVTFVPGKGACFTLALPLTVTTLRALLVRVGAELYAIPSSNIEKLVRASAGELALVQGRETLLAGGTPLSLVSLAEIVGAEAATPAASLGKLPIVILAQPGERVALSVDELLAEQDVVVKPLGKRVRRLRHVSGATLLPSGRVGLLLHAGDVLRTALGRVPARRAAAVLEATAVTARKRILLVDDSATTRTLEKSILEAAGYDVFVAVDGASAWQLLQAQDVEVVISDVEMPNMNGFTLAQTIRGAKRFRDLPIVLLTSLDTEQDRARGLESGADAYLVKSAFDQGNLLETIRQLL